MGKKLEKQLSKQMRTNFAWCHSYNITWFKELLPWTSKNKKIDEIIKEAQLESFFEWVEYEEFDKIELIAEGGFGSVSKAIWNSGYVISFNKTQRKLVRAGPSLVALKMLFNSNNANCNTIQEVSEY
ncbi:3577_t:CDS:2 [Ambispora leptoticha]|uniref:3577_t:CDS:1 n=1 Tax=Ambispora leptoticha TaxID=144679 RepID=A0A9N9FC53_9GLOM|nr:3577_t:CDS:2 [Ambispora leptoticha]